MLRLPENYPSRKKHYQISVPPDCITPDHLFFQPIDLTLFTHIKIICNHVLQFSEFFSKFQVDKGKSSEKDMICELRKNRNPPSTIIINNMLITMAKVAGIRFDSNHRLTGINRKVSRMPKLTGISMVLPATRINIIMIKSSRYPVPLM